MNCNDFKSVELKKILSDNNVIGRAKYTTKSEMCKVIEKLGLLSSSRKVTKSNSSKKPSKIAVSKPVPKTKSRKSAKKPAKVKEAKKEFVYSAIESRQEPYKEAKKISEVVPIVVESKLKAEKEATKELELVHNLVAHGFVPKHKSHEADEALKYLQSIVKHFPLTDQCVGNYQYQEWFEYLLKQEQFHPSLETTPDLILKVNDKYIVSVSAGSHLIIQKQIAKQKNTVVPIGVHFYQKSEEQGHANMILINTSNKRYEFFEPHGYFSQAVANTQTNLDTKHILQVELSVQNYMQHEVAALLHIPSDYQFAMAYEDCPYIFGPQNSHSRDKREKCSNGGFCLAYSTVYAHLRFLAPDALPEKTIETLKNMNGDQMLDFIRRYVGWQNAVGLHTNG